VAGQGIRRQQDYVEQQDKSADSHPDSSLKEESAERVVPKKDKEDESNIQKVAMQVLKNKREPGLALVTVFAALADGTGRRIEKKCPVVSLPVVVASHPESQRPNQNQ
jgi:hypothetical protein